MKVIENPTFIDDFLSKTSTVIDIYIYTHIYIHTYICESRGFPIATFVYWRYTVCKAHTDQPFVHHNFEPYPHGFLHFRDSQHAQWNALSSYRSFGLIMPNWLGLKSEIGLCTPSKWCHSYGIISHNWEMMVSNNEIGHEIFGRPIAGTAMAMSIYFTKENDDRNDDLYYI